MDVAATVPPRHTPPINEMNRYFWCGGADGKLHIMQCLDCRIWIHPFAARCPACHSANVSPQPVSGRGTVVGYTVNHQPWILGVPVPYVVAIVELAEQSDLRLMTNLPRTEIADVHVGMPVSVYFEQQDDIFLPMFEAVGSAS